MLRRRWQRWAGLTALLVAVLTLGGCVWLRLLTVKHQLQDFDRYIETAGAPGLELRFREPVLLAEDLDVIVQGFPTSVARSGTATVAGVTPPDLNEVRAYVFRKVAADQPEPDTATLTLVVVCTIQDGLVQRVAFPTEVFAVIPRDLAIAGLRALGNATVDQSAQTATGSLAAGSLTESAVLAAQLPTRVDLIRQFGTPNRQRRLSDAPADLLLWQYSLMGESLRHDGKPVMAALGFVFSDGSDRPSRFLMTVAGMWGRLDLPQVSTPTGVSTGAAPAVEVVPMVPLPKNH